MVKKGKTGVQGHNQAHPQSPSSGLELPEGYTGKKKPLKRGGRQKKEPTTGPTIQETVTMPPVPGSRAAPADRAGSRLLHEQADELGVDLNPRTKVKMLVFNMNRTWRSVKDAKFLTWYGAFQKRKLDPMVFACEFPTAPADPTDEADDVDVTTLTQAQLEWARTSSLSPRQRQAEFIDWYQQCRLAFYLEENRMDELRALERAAHWPHHHGVVTKAPFVRSNEHRHKENVRNRNLGLFKALRIKDVGFMILKHLDKHYLALANISHTCHTGFDMIGQFVEIWNLTPPGDFMGEDRVAPSAKDGIDRSPVTLIVTPIRKDMSRLDVERPESTYAEDYRAQTKLLRALNNRAALLTNLQLHRMQFVDVKGLDCILASLPQLKTLGVYQCPLLHLGKASEVLDIIRHNPKHHVGDNYSYVHLDLYPMFHEGPNSLIRQGSFGATWNHPGCDLATGIIQLVLYELYPKAQSLNIDILEWGCAFRQFLEKCPMPKWGILRMYEAIKTIEHGNRAVGGKFDIVAYKPSDNNWEQFANDITAAVRGDGIEPSTIPGPVLNQALRGYQSSRRRKFGWWQATKDCTSCRAVVLAVFTPFNEGRCWSCIAKKSLNAQWDHFKTFKAQAASIAFGKCMDLDDVLRLPKVWHICCYNLALFDDSGLSDVSLDVFTCETEELLADEGSYPAYSDLFRPATPVSDIWSSYFSSSTTPNSPESAGGSSGESLGRIFLDMRLSPADRGLFVAGQMDVFRQLEMSNDHGLDRADWADHADFTNLHRRLARHYEAHGPVDRKLCDVQYHPIGRQGAHANHASVPSCWPKYIALLKTLAWDERHPIGTARDEDDAKKIEAVRQTRRESAHSRHLDHGRRYADHYIKEQNAQDELNVRIASDLLHTREQWPNLTPYNWDEYMIDLFKCSGFEDKNGRPLKVPYCLRDQSRWS